MTPSGIEPATFRFVAQHLNHCATAVPSLQGPLSLYCKTVPADFNSETRNPVALLKPWSGSTGQVYVQFK